MTNFGNFDSGTQGQTMTQVSGFILEEQVGLTLAELCRACGVQTELLLSWSRKA